MKKKFSIVLVVMMLVALLTVGLVSCKPEEEEKPTEESINTVITKIIETMDKTYGFSQKNAVGWDYEAYAVVNGEEWDIITQGRLDPKNPTTAKIDFKVTNSNGELVLRVSADDEFMFLETATAKHRYTGLNLGDMIGGGFAEFTQLSSIVSLALQAVFTEYTVDETTYSLKGNLGAIADIAGSALPAEIADLLKGINVTFNCDLEGDKFNNFDLTVSTGIIGDVTIAMDEGALGNNVAPTITVPAKDDAAFVESQLINFSIEGTFSLVNKDANYNRTNMADYNYKLFVDVNPFDIIRQGGLFKSETSKIYFDISHKCTEACGDFCGGKWDPTPSKGSILTVAYDSSSTEANFDNNQLYVAINAKQIIPKDVLTILGLDSGTQDLAGGFIGQFLGLSVDPATLLGSIGGATAQETALTVGGVTIPGNIASIVGDALDLLFSLKAEGAVSLEVEPLLNLLDNFDLGMNLPAIVGGLLGNADEIRVDANFKYADTSYNDFNIFKEFTMIDKNVGEYKDFASYTPAGKFEWVKDAKGNAMISSDALLYDEKGNPLTVSADEMKYALTNGSIKYNWTNIYGETESSSSAKILKVSNIDYTKFNEVQNVEITTNVVGGPAGLLSLLAGFLHINVEIPSQVVTIPVVLTQTESVEWTQASVKADESWTDEQKAAFEDSKIKADKEYKYDDFMYVKYDFVITYVGGEQKVVKEVAPTNVGNFIYSANTKPNGKSGSKVQAFQDFTLTYSKFGFEHNVNVNMADYKFENNTIKATISIGETWEMPKQDITIYTKEDKSDAKVFKEASPDEKTTILPQIDGMTADLGYNKGSLTFAKPGKYEFTANYFAGSTRPLGAIPVNFEITVLDKIVVPGYKATANFTAKDMIIVTFNRANQIGGDINVTPVLSVFDKENKETVLEFGKDYQIGKMNGEEFVAQENVLLDAYMPLGKQAVIKITNEAYANGNYKANVTFVWTVDNKPYDVCKVENVLAANMSNYSIDLVYTNKTGLIGDVNYFAFQVKPILKGDAIDGGVTIEIEYSTDEKIWTKVDSYKELAYSTTDKLLVELSTIDSKFEFTADGTPDLGKGYDDKYYLGVEAENLQKGKVYFRVTVKAANFGSVVLAQDSYGYTIK